jgi:DNA-binding YbaB/EbfC family protein
MDIMGMMKKAGAMQAKMAEMQAELENVTVDGAAGGGMVTVVITAKGVLKSVSIDPSLLKADEKEILEDLIVAAHGEARQKAESLLEEKMKAVTAGIGLPAGFKMPF